MEALISGILAFVVFIVVPIAVVVVLVGAMFALMFVLMSWKRNPDKDVQKSGVLSGKHLPRGIIARAGPYNDDNR